MRLLSIRVCGAEVSGFSDATLFHMRTQSSVDSPSPLHASG